MLYVHLVESFVCTATKTLISGGREGVSSFFAFFTRSSWRGVQSCSTFRYVRSTGEEELRAVSCLRNAEMPFEHARD